MHTEAVLTIFVLAAVASAQNFSVNTPASLVVCQPAAIAWTGGIGPFILDIIPGGQVSAAALEELATGLNDNTYTWNVNLAAQTSITVKITDSKGTIAYSSLETIQPGSSTACLNSTASATAGGAAGYATTAGGSSTAAVAGTSTSAVSSTAATSAVKTPSTTGPSPAAASSPSQTSASGSSSSSAPSASASNNAGYFSSIIELPAIALAALGGIIALL